MVTHNSIEEKLDAALSKALETNKVDDDLQEKVILQEEDSEDAAEAQDENSKEAEEASEEDTVEEEEEAPEDGTEGSETETETTSKAGSERQPPAAPAHLNEDERKAFDSLPAEAKEFVTQQIKKSEAFVTRKLQDVQPFRDVLNEVEPYFKQVGSDTGAVLRDAAKIDHAFRFGTQEQKQQTLQALCQAYGVELPKAQADGEQEYIDPLEQKLSSVERKLQMLERQPILQAEQQAQRAIAEFSSAKDDQGNLLYPHFNNNEVRRFMAAVPMNTVEDMKAAYNKAVRAVFYDDLVKQEHEKLKQDRAKEQAEALAKAKKASKVNVKSSKTRAAKANKTWEDTLGEAVSSVQW